MSSYISNSMQMCSKNWQRNGHTNANTMRWRVSGSIASPGTLPPFYPLFLFNCNYVALYEAAPLSEFLYSLYKITQQNGSILISPSTQIQNILHPSHPFGISCHPEMTPSSKENHCTVHSRMLDRHETTGSLRNAIQIQSSVAPIEMLVNAGSQR